MDSKRVEEIRRDIARLEGELAEVEERGLVIRCDRTEHESDLPPGDGYVVFASWDIWGTQWTWFRNEGDAEAYLLALARQDGSRPDDPWRVDLRGGDAFILTADRLRQEYLE